MSLPNGLLASAKIYLDITWEDAATDSKLSGILSRGITYLDNIAGVMLDYAEGTTARALLFDYARYVRANALQDFSSDFASELIAMQIFGEVEQAGGEVDDETDASI